MRLTGDTRILQLHATRRCNLECLHCYSRSGPRERDELPVAVVRDLLDDAAAEGYRVVSLSGGEPLLYRGLAETVRHARSLGLACAVITNGTLLGDDAVAMLGELECAVAISLDGRPAHHDRIRGRAGAFGKLERGLERLARARVPFRIVFTLSENSADDLAWAARFAAGHGAVALHVHPLDETGRAAERLAGQRPGAETRAAIWLAVAYLRSVHPNLAIHVDLVDAESVPANVLPDAALAGDAALAELVSPLVVEPDGVVVPLQYGLSRRHALGSLHEARLAELSRRWRSGPYQAFRRACAGALRAVMVPSDLPFVDLYRELAAQIATR